MSKPTEPKLVTVALNCSVKVSGTLYAPDDVIQVTEDIAERLIAQKAADPWTPEPDPEVEIKKDEEPKGDETPTPGDKDSSKPKGGKDKAAPADEKETAA